MLLNRNQAVRSMLGVAALAFVFAVCLPVTAEAQSGTRNPASGGRTPAGSDQRAPAGSDSRNPAGSGQRAPAVQGPVAMSGFCPVCVIDMKQWIRGKPEFQAAYDGKTYLFPGAEQRDMFLANPEKYVPALGGDCTVCYLNMGQRSPGTVEHTALLNQRLYMFPNNELKQEFMTNWKKYTGADVALGGQCSVCRVELNEAIPGKPEFSVVYRGLRYWFPGEEQKRMFLSNPAKYAMPPAAGNR